MNALLAGILVTASWQIDEVIDYVNAVAFFATNTYEVTEYLDKIDNRAVPVVAIDHLYLDPSHKYVYKDPTELRNALANSRHFGKIVFMFDEPMWKARNSGQDKQEVLAIMQQIKADFPGVEFAHMESYAELFYQYNENGGQLTLLYEADHIGFNCYGEFKSCGGLGIPNLPQMTYINVVQNAINNANSSAKLFFVPGAFLSPWYMTDEQMVIEQLYDYAAAVNQNRENVSIVGFFTWGDINSDGSQSQGARNFPRIVEALQHCMDIILNPQEREMAQ